VAISVTPEVPSLELLCYHQRGPAMRVVDPSTGQQHQFSGQKAFGQAIDHVLARDGWVAALAGYTYTVGLTDGAKPRRLERGWSLIGSIDRRCIWVLRGRTWCEYDGVAGTYGREVPAAPGNWLIADTPLGPLVFDSDRRPAPRSRWALPRPQTMVVVDSAAAGPRHPAGVEGRPEPVAGGAPRLGGQRDGRPSAVAAAPDPDRPRLAVT